MHMCVNINECMHRLSLSSSFVYVYVRLSIFISNMSVYVNGYFMYVENVNTVYPFPYVVCVTTTWVYMLLF